MLQEIYIHNFILIDELRLDFIQGMNVLSGETGAGKSMIMDALSLLMGERVRSDYLRDESRKAVIEAVFDLDGNQNACYFLDEQGLMLEDEDGIVVVTREIFPNGKTVARINNRIVTAAMLKSLSEYIIDINGQSDRLSVLQTSMYLDYLDSFIRGQESIIQELAVSFGQWMEARRELKNLQENRQERLQRLDLLSYQIEEIERANLQVGEDQELEELRERIKNAQQLMEGSIKILNLLYNGSESAAAYDLLYNAISVTQDLKDEPFFTRLVEPLENIYYQIEDLAEQVSRFRERLDFEPGLLEQTEDRIYEIGRLKKKYGSSIPEIYEYLEKARVECSALDSSDERENKLLEQVQALKERYESLAMELHDCRLEAARVFETRVESELLDLNMPHIQFQVKLSEKEPGPRGTDAVDLLFSPNPGEEMRPLAKTASGGEISRFVLAVKKALADVYEVPTLVFDEIDTGLGGAALNAMAKKIAELSQKHQTIVITHSPQLSSYAERHFQVEKYVEDGRTFTRVKLLSEGERVEELARMLDGEHFSELTLEHAREMLDKNGR